MDGYPAGMYESYFGLKQPPFSIAPDPRYLYMSARHREALAHLLYGVKAGGGFVLLTGAIGAGKTTVCRCFLGQLLPGCQVAYIVNPKLTVLELLQTVAQEFGLSPPPGDGQSVKAWVDVLNQHLLAAHAHGSDCVLIIDEAQNLSNEVLEQLRLLTNLETNERKLLQIILIGQPELRDQLAAPRMEQLAQRVIARYHLQALGEAETRDYVAHRMAVAGLAGPIPFDVAALRRVHALTGGVPRRINLLCDRALLGGYAQGVVRITRRTVERAAQEVFGDGRRQVSSAWRWPLVLAGVGAVAAALWAALWINGSGGRAQPLVTWSGPASAVRPASAPQAAKVAANEASAAASVAASVAASGPRLQVATSAAGAATRAPSTPMPPFDAGSDWPALLADESAALRELVASWDAALPAAAPCFAAASQRLACLRLRSGSLPLLRQLDRPVLLVLVDSGGRSALARLVALHADSAVLAAGPRQWQTTVAQLASLWRGELLTFWRLPEDIAGPLAPGAPAPAVAALTQLLARAEARQAALVSTNARVEASAVASARAASAAAPGQRYDAALRQRVAAFQLGAGLKPDGLAGPTTFMLLNRALAVAEPRLVQE